MKKLLKKQMKKTLKGSQPNRKKIRTQRNNSNKKKKNTLKGETRNQKKKKNRK